MATSLEQDVQVAKRPWNRVYRQPWKTFYLVSQFSFLLFIRAPLLGTQFLIPALRPSPKWSWLQSIFVPLFRDFFHIATHAGLIQARKDVEKADMLDAKACGRDCRGVFVDPVPESDIVGEIKEIMIGNDVHPAGVPAYWFGHEVGTVPIAPAGKDEKLIVHFHGSGYVAGSALPGGLPRALVTQARAHPSKPISRILNVEYRLCRATPLSAPANAFPAALLDAVSVVYHVVFDLGYHPRNVILSGDSAGAHVVLSATRYLRDAPLPASRVTNMPLPAHLEGVMSLMPGGMILISPLCDILSLYPLGSRDPTSSFVLNTETDIVGGKVLTRQSLASDPFVSPGSPDCPLTIPTRNMDGTSASERPTFERYPPAYFSLGGKEVLRDEIRVCAHRFTEHSTLASLPSPSSKPSDGQGPIEPGSITHLIPQDGEEAQPKVWPWVVMDEEPEMWHNFAALAPSVSKETRRTLESIVAWLSALPQAGDYPV
ncbi:alpha/beta-hydrolase [Clavulina sp. PMI_390]|nr:alpha/beta-hydrolase [Clavulina sp. PMI_390]